jgi:hypothetical protein
MSKFNVAKKVTEITKKLQEDTANYDSMVKEENKELTNAIINIGSKEGGSGGAGTGVVVRTPAYNKWLASVQARNPFIGQSYMQRAEEYERDDEEAKEQTQMEDVDAAKIMFKDSDGTLHIRDDYDPNSIDEEVENEKLTGDASKLADLCEINKIVATQITWDFDSLLKEVEAKLEEIHADEDDYELPENLAEQLKSSINHAKSVAAITYAREHKEATNGEKEEK